MLAAQEAGATVFMVPADNCDEASSMRDDNMELVKVENLAGAVDSLHTLTSGGRPPSC
jgi:PDZ domain-containing protein